jgi:hypothetical protein
MADLPIDSSDEGGDPACWAHLFESEDGADSADEPTEPVDGDE